MSDPDEVQIARRFEDLVAWQKARVLTKVVYEASSSGDFGRDFGLRDQIRRAAVSVMSNVAEGYARKNPADFARFLLIAKASAAEVQSQLYVALDLRYIDASVFRRLTELADETARVIEGLHRSVVRQSGPARG